MRTHFLSQLQNSVQIQTRVLQLPLLLLTAVTAFTAEEGPREDLFLSTPEQVASLTSNSEFLVGDLIAALSGQPVLRTTDLIVKGAQDITLSRVYISPRIPAFPKRRHQEEYNKKFLSAHLQNNYKGWQFYPHLRLELNTRSMQVRLSDPSGVTLDFQLSGPDSSTSALASPSYALCNAVGERPSGIYDLRNTRVFYEENGNKIKVKAPDGTIRLYYKKGSLAPFSSFYLLEKEILPNAKILRYHYNDQGRLDFVKSCDPQEQHTYAFLRVEGSPWEGRSHFVSSAETTVDYTYQQKMLSWKIKEKIEGGVYKEESKSVSPPILSAVSSPFYRYETLDYSDLFLLKSYAGKKDVFIPIYGSEENARDKVSELLIPSGPNDAFVSLYQLSYQPAIPGKTGGVTTVTRKDGAQTIYFFSKELLIEKIQWFCQKEKLKKEKRFSWDAQQRLKSIELIDGNGELFYRRSYEDYDEFGNPGREIFSGDLTGNGQISQTTFRRRFSQDGLNLLLREENDDGLITIYEYLPSANLLKSKITQKKNKILIRELYEYDDCANLIKKSIDDGTSVQRSTTTYVLRQKSPFLHMPEWVEKTSPSGLIQKTKLTYDRYGNVSQEDVYGSDGQFAYSVSRVYDEQGNLQFETNPMGVRTTYTYDPRGFLDESENGSGRLKIQKKYDLAGRLRKTIEIGDANCIRSTSFDYDCLGCLEKETDHFGNITFYHDYDPIIDQPTRIDYPSIESADGEGPISVVCTFTYDAVGRISTQTDANHCTTITRYNAYDSPIEILYPNGSKETFTYYLNGDLHVHTDREGLITEYLYDCLGRITEKRYFSDDQQLLTQEIFTADSFHSLTMTDKENALTTFSYDDCGRKIREDHEGRIVEFVYDTLGRVVQEIHQNGENTLCISKDFDRSGQLIEERKTDVAGNVLFRISYSYDADGHRTSEIRYPHNQAAITTYSYDPWGRVIKVEDPMGSVTTTTYDESKSNALNQRVLTQTIQDPNGMNTVIEYDALGREVSHDSDLVSEKCFYDPVGNLLQIQEGTHLTRYAYNVLNLPETVTHNFGTLDAWMNTTAYTPSGNLKTRWLSNGTALNYTYDCLGYLKTIQSSDGAVARTFIYNFNGDLLRASDVHHTVGRTVDAFGNILTESIDGKVMFTKTYDALDRPLTLIFSDGSSIHTTYDPLYVRRIDRLSSTQQMLYSQTYRSYDQNGDLLMSSFPENLGDEIRVYNPNGYLQSLSSSYFSQTLMYDPAGRIENVSTESHFAYKDLPELPPESDVASCSYDPLGRLFSKTTNGETEHYVYDGFEEIASMVPAGAIKNLRVLGLDHMPVALERQGRLFVPIVDYSGKICRLIDPEKRSNSNLQ